jgi:Fe-S-cluster containining protein
MSDDERMTANRKARHEKKEAYLRAIYERHLERFRAAAGQDPLSVASETHAAIDALIRQDQAKDVASAGIRCGKGCSHCCHEPVEIWPHEAALLVEIMRKAGREFDRVRLERQSAYTVETWPQQAAADKACTFLGEGGACTVYEFRPNVCRKLLVVTDPVLCDASQSQPDSVGRWFSWEAELMESAALETFGAGLMPVMLLQALHAQDKAD